MTLPKPILCVGALTADLMMQVPALPASPGKFLAERAAFVAAGMATSAATAVARLGHPVLLWASAGDDALGDFILAEIVRDGIDTSLVRRIAGASSAVATILVDGRGERVVVPFYDAPLLTRPEAVPDFAGLSAVLVDVRWPEAAAIALDGARAAGIPAILDLDVGATQTLGDLAGRATIIIASLAGARILTGAADLPSAVDALARLYPAAAIIVTSGEDGARFVMPGRRDHGHQPAFLVDAVDTNAAGDIFHGAFAVASAEQKPIRDAVRFASAAAAIKCTRYGGRTGAPTRAEVDAFLDARREAA